ncbi:hypothetical protein [Desulfosporosinus youngiae]|uniref:hypothetical protein n=1 Tax=Desulfosporosinus youngiae TaxID=339862 RepID=UPI00145F771A|nr:hypothetical protein [Desulfosporosinus youngiae]
MHGEAVKAHKTMRGYGATGSHQVLPRGLAKSRTGEWASLGMLRYEDTVFARIN